MCSLLILDINNSCTCYNVDSVLGTGNMYDSYGKVCRFTHQHYSAFHIVNTSSLSSFLILFCQENSVWWSKCLLLNFNFVASRATLVPKAELPQAHKKYACSLFEAFPLVLWIWPTQQHNILCMKNSENV